MVDVPGGERIYVQVPCDFCELSDEERWAWARRAMDAHQGACEMSLPS